ncbi:MAG TPA: hypothetical protein VET87_06360 [Rubrivivax sp.]|jgi:hypothetical protein|nr:hypothetical protein [Rubrivivax sp.]
MKILLALAITALLAGGLPVSALAQAGAAKPDADRGSAVAPPRTTQPEPLIAPRIVPPLVKPKPPTADPPALQGGKPAPLGGYNDAARRCESLSDIEQRTRCRDRVVREFPVRPPG